MESSPTSRMLPTLIEVIAVRDMQRATLLHLCIFLCEHVQLSGHKLVGCIQLMRPQPH